MSHLTITQVVEDDTNIDIRTPSNSWDGYLVVEARDNLTAQSVMGLYITREKAAELRDLLDEVLAEPDPDENAAEANYAQIRAVGT